MAGETGPSSNETPRESSRAKSANRDPKSSSGEGLIAFTIDRASGRIVKVEAVEESGTRRELSADDKAALAEQSADATLEDILVEAFEAGISSVLYPEVDDHEGPESEEEAILRRMILRPMIERSAARRLMKREVLSRAILGTLILQTPGMREAELERDAARPRAASSSAGPRRGASRSGRTRH
jgi:hypothetical protein